MCCKDILEQKFGRLQKDSGITNEQKSLNGFDRAVYFPTNWRSYNPLESKYPEFLRFGAFNPQSAEYYEKNYFGIYPVKQQPTLEIPQPYTRLRFS